MNSINKKLNISALQICLSIIVAVIIMEYVDGLWQPGYLIKSIFKIIVFMSVILLYCKIQNENIFTQIFGKGIDRRILFLAIGIYVVIVSAYFISRSFFDYSNIKDSLLSSTGVSKENFLYVSLYISFVNSFLEEIFFRGFGYFVLKGKIHPSAANLFSAIVFALYHCAMMIGWINWVFYLLLVCGLVIGGLLFNYVDEISGTITTSWLIHMFANFAINTIGFMIL